MKYRVWIKATSDGWWVELTKPISLDRAEARAARTRKMNPGKQVEVWAA